MISTDLPTPERALVIVAHPDDAEFQTGATLAKWARAGSAIHHLVLTDGSKGTWDVDADVLELAARRQEEQLEAARRLCGDGAGDVVFLGRIDGELENDREARSQLAAIIRRLQPEVVLGHDPWKRYRLHPDHRNAGLLVGDAVVGARDPHFYPEHGIAHHRPSHLLLWEADAPDHIEDVSDWVDRKLDALEAHESQFESTMKAVDSDELDAFRTRIRDRLTDLGAPHGLAAAEQFKLISDL